MHLGVLGHVAFQQEELAAELAFRGGDSQRAVEWAEQARLLGAASWADYVTEDKMSKSATTGVVGSNLAMTS